jgi:NhaA family Na+:H+ antiporter
VLTKDEFAENEQRIAEIARLAMFSTSPLERLERALSPWVAYVVVPLFALANAGVALTGDAVGGVVSDPVTLGVILGLFVGKTVGVLGATALAVRLGVGRLPAGTTWRHVLGLSVTAGVGFTVALFVTSLAFDGTAVSDAAKVGILVGSTLAGVVGYLILRTSTAAARATRSDDAEPAAAAPDARVAAAPGAAAAVASVPSGGADLSDVPGAVTLPLS